jgi:hypothetical protein
MPVPLFRVQSLRFRVYGFGVQGLGFMDSGLDKHAQEGPMRLHSCACVVVCYSCVCVVVSYVWS